MATSGTIGATIIDVMTTIDTGFERCGIDPSGVTANQVNMALNDLFFLLTDLSNTGTNLWCISKTVLSLVQNQSFILLPAGTLDIARANYRSLTFNSGTALSGATYNGIQFSAAQNVTTVGFVAGAAAVSSLVLEASADNVTWNSVYTLTSTASLVAGTTYWFDVDLSTSAAYWRIRETVAGTIVAMPTTYFGNNPAEIPMAPMSRDDYTALPNKEATGRALQYWYDRQMDPNVRLWLWPTPNDATAQIVAWLHHEIQDVGSLTNTLQVPTRWLQYINTALAQRISYYPKLGVDPSVKADIANQVDFYLKRAEDGETDGAPIRIAPRIGCYTK